ncbi:MAG: zinc-binding dehydrogenase [Candidatus Bathyarchaeia archaeon]
MRVEEIELPKLGPDDVLVRVRACGICGSDLHRYLGSKYGRRFRYPLNSGHEYGGDVVQVGDRVSSLKVGDRVTLGLNWLRSPGAFSEYVKIENADRNAKKIPPSITYEEAALLEPLRVALTGVSQLKPGPKDTVLILGAGPIGLCVLQACLAKGVHTAIVVEQSRIRLEAAERLGGKTVDARGGAVERRVRGLADGRSIDLAFECAGASVTTREALRLVRSGGKVNLIAHYGRRAFIDPESIVGKQLTVVGSGGDDQFFDEAADLVAKGKVTVKPLVTHEYHLTQTKEAFETALQADIAIKVLVKP